MFFELCVNGSNIGAIRHTVMRMLADYALDSDCLRPIWRRQRQQNYYQDGWHKTRFCCFCQ